MEECVEYFVGENMASVHEGRQSEDKGHKDATTTALQ